MERISELTPANAASNAAENDALQEESPALLHAAGNRYAVVEKPVPVRVNNKRFACSSQDARFQPDSQDGTSRAGHVREHQTHQTSPLSVNELRLPGKPGNIDINITNSLLKLIGAESLTAADITALIGHFGIHIILHPEVQPSFKSQLDSFNDEQKSIIVKMAKLGYWEIIRTLLRKDILDILPKSLIPPELYLFACQRNGLTLKKVPAEVFKTAAGIPICAAACEERGRALADVPGFFFDEDSYREIGYRLCKIACAKNGDALAYVPEKYLRGIKGRTLCEIASQSKYGFAYPHIPEGFKNGAFGARFLELAAEQSGKCLAYFDRRFFQSDVGREICINIFIRHGVSSLTYIDETILNDIGIGPALCNEAVKIDGYAIFFTPGKYLTGIGGLGLIFKASETYDEALETLPVLLDSRVININERFHFFACGVNAKNYRYIKKECLTKETEISLTGVVLNKCGEMLEFVRPELLHSEHGQKFCETACHQNPGALKFVPKTLLTLPRGLALCEDCLSKRGWLLEVIPLNELSDEDALRLCGIACGHEAGALKYVPDRIKNDQLCRLAHNRLAYSCDKAIIPHITDSFFMTLIERHLVTEQQAAGQLPDIIRRCQRLCNHLMPELIKQCVHQSGAHHLAVLTSSDVSGELKKQLIGLINTPPRLKRPVTSQTRFTEPVNPLDSDAHDPFHNELLHSCFHATGYTPPRFSEGTRLHNYIERNRLTAFPPCPAEELNRMKRKTAAIAGGRTIRIYDNGEYYHYKFQRQDESPQVLVTQGLIYQYFKREKARIPLHSRIPVFVCFAAVKKSELPAITGRLEDEIKIDAQNRVNLLCYKASENYTRYAHQRSDKEGDTFTGPEGGLLTACRDLGLMDSAGVVLTGVIPAFHSGAVIGRWIALRSFLGSRPNEEILYPGQFSGWRQSATERPDIGYDGLRNLSDYELFGNINGYFESSSNLNYSIYPEPVIQRLAFSNAICEQLTAVILLRSRLRSQQAGTYHYKDTAAVERTKEFIAKSCEAFLQGYFTPKTAPSLQSALGLSETVYQRWLTSAAKEILYWTAIQPLLSGDELTADNAQTETYSHDILRKGRLCPELYPDAPAAGHIVRKDFFSEDNELILGIAHKPFAINFFLRGVMRLSIKIFEIRGAVVT